MTNVPSASYVPLDPCQPVIATIRTAMEEGDRPGVYRPGRHRVRSNGISCPRLVCAEERLSCRVFRGRLAFSSLSQTAQPTVVTDQMDGVQIARTRIGLSCYSCVCVPSKTGRGCATRIQNRWPYEVPEWVEGRPALHPGRTPYVVFPALRIALSDRTGRAETDWKPDPTLGYPSMGIKELLLETRLRWLATRPAHLQQESNWVTPQLLQMYLQYVRNLALGERRLTPDLYTLALAAKQFAGDEFAVTLLETAKSYEYEPDESLRAVSAAVFRRPRLARILGRRCLRREGSVEEHAAGMANVVAQAAV